MNDAYSRAAFLAGGGAVLAAPRAARAAAPRIALGDDVFIREAWRELRGRTLGIVTNPSGVLSTGETVVDAIVRAGNLRVKALFGPEHGIRGTTGAGEHVASAVDTRTGLPVHSLYGATRRPTAAMLDGIDVLVFDIQDVGARPYTYVSTMAYVMQAAAAAGKDVWVLDRPNPIGGRLIDGPVLEPRYASFIGLYPIPERHGMTVGELARLFNEQFGIGCTLAALAPNYWLFAGALVIIGLATLTFTNTTNSLMQLSTEPAMRGRVMALRVGIALGGTPIGAPIVGWVANHFGPRWALGVGAASGFAAALVAIYASMRTKDGRSPTVSP